MVVYLILGVVLVAGAGCFVPDLVDDVQEGRALSDWRLCSTHSTPCMDSSRATLRFGSEGGRRSALDTWFVLDGRGEVSEVQFREGDRDWLQENAAGVDVQSVGDDVVAVGVRDDHVAEVQSGWSGALFSGLLAALLGAAGAIALVYTRIARRAGRGWSDKAPEMTLQQVPAVLDLLVWSSAAGVIALVVGLGAAGAAAIAGTTLVVRVVRRQLAIHVARTP